MNVLIPEETPFIMFSKKFSEVDAMFVFMILEEDAFPATTEYIVFVAEVREFVGFGITIDVVEIIPFMFDVNIPSV